MQSTAPEVVDISGETEATRRMYGLEDPVTRDFGTRCLLARRMVERGVRFVQLYSGDTNGWDAHEDVLDNHTLHCARTDRPVAALIRDLKARGLLEDTLVVWGGEFGRTPMGENREKTGRNHHIDAFTMWFAGGGVKAGHTMGASDELGFNAVEDRAHVHDIHATLLHLLGIEHKKLTFRFQGRDFRLTDVHGKILHGMLDQTPVA